MWGLNHAALTAITSSTAPDPVFNIFNTHYVLFSRTMVSLFCSQGASMYSCTASMLKPRTEDVEALATLIAVIRFPSNGVDLQMYSCQVHGVHISTALL